MTDAETTPTAPIPPVDASMPTPEQTPPAENPPTHHHWAGNRGHFVADWVIALAVVGALLFGAVAFSTGWLGGSMAGRFAGGRGQMMARGYGFHHGFEGRGGHGGFGPGRMMRPGGQNFREQPFNPHGRGGNMGGGNGSWTLPYGSGVATQPVQ